MRKELVQQDEQDPKDCDLTGRATAHDFPFLGVDKEVKCFYRLPDHTSELPIQKSTPESKGSTGYHWNLSSF